MRILSIIACCGALFGVHPPAFAQSFEDAGATAMGPDLPSLREFRVDYSGGGAPASFDRQMADVHFDSEEPARPQWFDPSLVIAGAKVAPNRKGLKVTIPTRAPPRRTDARAPLATGRSAKRIVNAGPLASAGGTADIGAEPFSRRTGGRP